MEFQRAFISYAPSGMMRSKKFPTSGSFWPTAWYKGKSFATKPGCKRDPASTRSPSPLKTAMTNTSSRRNQSVLNDDKFLMPYASSTRLWPSSKRLHSPASWLARDTMTMASSMASACLRRSTDGLFRELLMQIHGDACVWECFSQRQTTACLCGVGAASADARVRLGPTDQLRPHLGETELTAF